MDEKELLKLKYYDVKNDLRVSCIKNCTDFKKITNDLTKEEKECMSICSDKIKVFLRISSDFYLNH